MAQIKHCRIICRVSLQFLFASLWIFLWWIIAKQIDIPFILPKPSSVGGELLGLLGTSLFYRTLLRSIGSLALGFLSGALIGILLSLPTALSKIFSSFISPIFTVIRATPVASFIIIAWVFLDNRELPAFIAALMTAPIVWSNLSRGLRSLDRSLFEVTRVFGFSFGKTVRYYFFPALRPFLASGLSTALGLAWKSSIATEILVRSNGTIGYYIWDAKAWNINTAALFAWTIAVIVLSLLFDLLVERLLRAPRRRPRKEMVPNAGN
jgi:NitT/TauT family transport system permease protein